MNPLPSSCLADQLSRIQRVLRHRLPAGLLALYLYGSAVQSRLQPYSDIDLLAVVDAPLPAAARLALMRDLLSVSAWPGSDPHCRAVELTVLVRADVVPWRFPPRRELQFGEWLREALQAGQAPQPEPDPDLAILLTQLRQHSVALLGPPAEDCFEPVPVQDLNAAMHRAAAQWEKPADWAGDERNVLLALARIWFSLCTGDIASKDAAAAWAAERLPQPCKGVMEHARDAYLGLASDRLDRQPEQVQACIARIKSRLPA